MGGACGRTGPVELRLRTCSTTRAWASSLARGGGWLGSLPQEACVASRGDAGWRVGVLAARGGTRAGAAVLAGGAAAVSGVGRLRMKEKRQGEEEEKEKMIIGPTC